MDKITFSINGNKCAVGSEVDSETSLNDYIRNVLNLRGTKFMCKEGGCGACVVAVTTFENGEKKTFSVNSCLVNITSCQDWNITTIEGIGNRGKGYHPIQKTLAEYNGTQCGYCSPGWVMSMYSLLEANNYDLKQYEIENSFGSNTCRCTGYRPILDAFKSFAKDAPKPVTKTVHDIEDLSDLSICKNKNGCQKKCGDWCFVNDSEVDPKSIKKINLKDNHIWYRVNSVKDIFTVLNTEGYDSYMLVNGNTGRGATPILVFPRVLIDISPIEDIKGHYLDKELIIGAGITLTDLMTLFKTTAEKYERFAYLQKLYDHLDLVAHIPVRNIGTVAGNLMVKHRTPTFSSDIFLLLETIGASLVIVGNNNTIEVTPEDFLHTDMNGRVIVHIKIPPLSKYCEFVSFKIMARSQNAHAQVNSGFLYEFDPYNPEILKSARIVIGGLSAHFVHARKTEQYLCDKKIFTNAVLQQSLGILHDELIVDEIAGEMSTEYRRKCALGLFYKGLLALIPQARLKPWYRSGARDFRKTRPLSKGLEVYDTNPIVWPLTEPTPKIDALIQCAGETKYCNDEVSEPKEVYCAFVTADICTGEIIEIDATPAMKIPGVLAFFSAQDIPGKNSFLSQKAPTQMVPEEIFASKEIKYYDQAIGLIVAESDRIAHKASLLVEVKYKVDKNKPLLRINDVKKTDPSRVSLSFVRPAIDRGFNVQKVISGSDNMKWQYHYCMETLTSVAKPTENGIEIYASTQWSDSVQLGVSEALNMNQSKINIIVPRCGGSYGLKITRTSHIACAAALVSYLMNRTCRFQLSLQASLRVIGKRFPVTRDFEVGVSDSGEIQYLEYDIYFDNGYVVSDSILVVAVSGLKSCYDSRRWTFKTFDVTTDTASNTYVRAPGSFETTAMTEQIMEQIAYELKLDPARVRLNNLNPQSPDAAEVIQTLLRDSQYENRKKEVELFNKLNRWKKRGLRVAFMSWPVASLVDYNILMSVFHGDGSVMITHGGVEMGQGIHTKVIQIVAFVLKISMNKIKIQPQSTSEIPNNFSTGGSRTTEAVCFGAIKCCQIILDRLSVVREALSDPTWEILIEAAFNRGINLQASYRVNGNDQEPYRSAGAAVAEVELDILTGEHEVLRVDIVEDVGTSVNPELDIGQVEGAFIFGMGFWTHEELIYDEKTGELLTDRSWYYKVPLAKDIPIDFRVQLRRNSYNPLGVLGARAVAEPPSCLAICVAFALREAIVSAREDSGHPRDKWFSVDGPFTLEANVIKSDAKIKDLLFN